jgi:aminoacrylate peracid reductase
MPFNAINPAEFPPLLPVYSRGARVGDFAYTSGVAAVDLQGATVGIGDIKAQTRCVLDAIKIILKACDATLADIFQVQVFIKDFDDYAGMNEVYSGYFFEKPPTRYCVRADMLRPEWLVEIAATAYIGK